MISVWTKNLKTDEEIIRFKNQLLGSKAILERIQQLMQEELDKAESTETSVSVYDIPNWDYKQADFNGFKRAIKLVNKLLTLDQGN